MILADILIFLSSSLLLCLVVNRFIQHKYLQQSDDILNSFVNNIYECIAIEASSKLHIDIDNLWIYICSPDGSSLVDWMKESYTMGILYLK